MQVPERGCVVALRAGARPKRRVPRRTSADVRAAILVLLLVAVALLSAILILLFLPGPSFQASGPSRRSREAALGRAVLDAARSDPGTATMVRAAAQSASQQDRELAAPLVADLPMP